MKKKKETDENFVYSFKKRNPRFFYAQKKNISCEKV